MLKLKVTLVIQSKISFLNKQATLTFFYFFFFPPFSMTISSVSLVACKFLVLPLPIHCLPQRRVPHRHQEAILNSIFMILTTIPLSWIYSFLKMKRGYFWQNKLVEILGKICENSSFVTCIEVRNLEK